jgi:aldehyde dehydrogenase (NAD+)
VSRRQFDRVQHFIDEAIKEGAILVTGGTGKPPGIEKGYFIMPTVFTNVNNRMSIAQEEIFGPVLCIIPYEDEDEAVSMANDSPYGLAAFVSSGNLQHARRVANRLRAGNVHINNARVDFSACFGGYKQSGNGREWGEAGIAEFLELKAVLGYAEAEAKK